MSVSLVEIPDVKPEWEVWYRIRALTVNGRTHALTALKELKKKHPVDYTKLMETIRQVVASRHVTNPSRVKKDDRGEDVYEMRGGHSRLFFFYAPHGGIVVCTHHYWKAKPSKREQDAEFRRCAKLRSLYLLEQPHSLFHDWR